MVSLLNEFLYGSPIGLVFGNFCSTVHRDILVPASHATIIDTPEFQRLRTIQQLSTCEYVFPAATHNRFAHSLGAYHLAGRLAAHLQEVHPGLLSKDDEELVQLAALLHDIGHPPYSHLLETQLQGIVHTLRFV